MPLLAIIYILTFIIFALAAYAVMQIKLAGINVKDFWSFIQANQILDGLYEASKRYEKILSAARNLKNFECESEIYNKTKLRNKVKK